MNQPLSSDRNSIRKLLKAEKANTVRSITRAKRGLRKIDREVSQVYTLCQLQGADLFAYLKASETPFPNVRGLLESKQRHNNRLKHRRKELQGVTEVLAWLPHVEAPMPPVEYIKALGVMSVRMKLRYYPYSDTESVLHPRFAMFQSILDELYRAEVIEVLARDGFVEGVNYDYDPVAREAVWRE